MSSNKERTNPSFGCALNYCRHIPKIKEEEEEEEEDGKVISSGWGGESSVE